MSVDFSKQNQILDLQDAVRTSEAAEAGNQNKQCTEQVETRKGKMP